MNSGVFGTSTVSTVGAVSTPLPRPYTAEEDRQIMQQFYIDGPEALGAKLGRTPNAIRVRHTRLQQDYQAFGDRPPAPSLWTCRQTRYLEENWTRLSVVEVAREVGHSTRACEKYAAKLGLPPKRVCYRQDQLEEISA